ncbi:MAG: T9SS type A sorting domain-containing protein [Crocinitomicaceae bacterium]|nr:T9SS type A sorting domain-containing protein [Crocinitomicaceae bacterium]
MKKLLLSLGGCLAIATASFSQTILFQDDFESGSSQWTLNTGSGANNWVVNNVYPGFAGLIPDTPNQPGSFTNSPQSTYMHITNTTVCGGLSVCNANYDTGSASNQNSEVATSIDASSYTNITVSFWYLCQGSTGVAFGNLEYSLDDGSTWVGTGTEYSGVSSWTQETVSMAAWDNAAAFKIRFKWQNGGAGLDPALSIDELTIVGTGGGGGSNAITTGNSIQPTSWCEGSIITLQVDFTSTGTFTGGNIYTAELSDGAGSFAAPLGIGTLASTANSGMITAMVPGSVAAGTGYRIRVVSDSPVTVGADNGSDFTINPLPTVTLAAFADVCDIDPFFTLTGGFPAGGTYTGLGITGGVFDPAAAGPGTHTITYSFVDGNGCVGQANGSIFVDVCGSIGENGLLNLVLYPNPASESFKLISDYDIESVQIFDMSGRTVKSFGEAQLSYDISSAPSGVYMVTVHTADHIAQLRIVVD